MTNKSFSLNYIKIYIWQFIALILRFTSFFIVIPYLTKNPAIYGTYAVCISITMFLNYADLGFLTASLKYASESYSKDDRTEEMQYLGFGMFILLIVSIIFSFCILYLAINPQFLIKGIDSSSNSLIASQILFVLALFTPVAVIQRIIASIFDIRLESYINQRISIFASFVTILSVFYFFHGNNYKIVHYLIFSQIMNVFVVITSVFLAKKKYDYSFSLFIRCIKFNKKVYQKVNRLAFAGLYNMIMWILFFELDQLVIGKYFGANKVAIYSIAFTFLTVFRSIFGIIFNPFSVRANYFLGRNDNEGLKRFCLNLLSFTAPLTVLSTVALSLVAKPFILSWVGSSFIDSINIAKLIALYFTFSFITYTGSIYLVVKERIKETYIISTISPIIYWIGILCTYSFLGLIAFPLFKNIINIILVVFYMSIILRFLKIPFLEFFKDTIMPLLLPVLFLVIVLSFSCNYLPLEKSKINLIIVTITMMISLLFSYLILFLTNKRTRITLRNIYWSFKPV